MGYYPVSLSLSGRRAVVIGGGAVAERKVEGLLDARAIVTVISPSLTEGLARLVRERRIDRLGRSYRAGDLADYEIAFAATNDPQTNAAVYEEGRRQKVWVNAADDPAHCDFILPSVLRRGDLVIAVSTGGSSPALSGAIREELESYFGEEHSALAEVAAEVRRELRHRAVTPSAEAWRKALNGEVRVLVRHGNLAEAQSYLLHRLENNSCE